MNINTKTLMESFLMNYRDDLEEQLRIARNSNKELRNGWVLKTTHPGDREHCPDIFQVNVLRVQHIEELIKKTDMALEKARNGKYGKCRCGKKIPQERLMAVPSTDY